MLSRAARDRLLPATATPPNARSRSNISPPLAQPTSHTRPVSPIQPLQDSPNRSRNPLVSACSTLHASLANPSYCAPSFFWPCVYSACAAYIAASTAIPSKWQCVLSTTNAPYTTWMPKPRSRSRWSAHSTTLRCGERELYAWQSHRESAVSARRGWPAKRKLS